MQASEDRRHDAEHALAAFVHCRAMLAYSPYIRHASLGRAGLPITRSAALRSHCRVEPTIVSLQDMVRLILVVVLGCTLDRDDRLGGRVNPFWFWLTVAAMVVVSGY